MNNKYIFFYFVKIVIFTHQYIKCLLIFYVLDIYNIIESITKNYLIYYLMLITLHKTDFILL